MKKTIVLIADNHFIFSSDGKAYVNGTYTQQYLKRFTSCFDKVIVVCRGKKQTNENLQSMRLSGGDGIEFAVLPDFKGIKEYIIKKNALRKIINCVVCACDAVFVRMPCILTTLSVKIARKHKKPIIVDVGADPFTIYRGSSKSLIRTFISYYLRSVCRKVCMIANGVSYVTKESLQKQYPCRALLEGESTNYFSASISNVDISNDFYFTTRSYGKINCVKLLHISNNIPKKSGKGHIECLNILHELSNKAINATLTFVGDGEGIDELKLLATNLGVADKVFFVGRIMDRDEYRKLFLAHDFFVFPSHSEGLPRVILEAMSTGMVCFASNVDGIPEIVDSGCIFKYSDIKAFATKIVDCYSNPDYLNRISQTNLQTSLSFSNDALKEIYVSFYKKVIKLMEKQ